MKLLYNILLLIGANKLIINKIKTKLCSSSYYNKCKLINIKHSLKTLTSFKRKLILNFKLPNLCG